MLHNFIINETYMDTADMTDFCPIYLRIYAQQVTIGLNIDGEKL